MEKVILKVKVEPCVDLTEEIFSGIDRHVEAAESGFIANVEAQVKVEDWDWGNKMGKKLFNGMYNTIHIT